MNSRWNQQQGKSGHKQRPLLQTGRVHRQQVRLSACLLCCLLLLTLACHKKNNYTYNLETLRQVAAGNLCYQPGHSLTLPLLKGGGLTLAGDNLLVTGDKVLLVLDRAGTLLQTIPLECEAGPLVATEERLYLACGDHIEVYNFQGEPLEEWASLGESAIITSLTTVKFGTTEARQTEILVADAGNHAVVRYTSTGRMLQRIGSSEGQARFIIPSPYFDLVGGQDGSFRVVNPGRHRIEHYTLSGELLDFWGQQGFELAGFAGCCNPVHLAAPAGGSFITAEKGLTRIKRYTEGGEFDCVIAAPDQFPPGTVIRDLAVHPSGTVYVLAENTDVQLYIFIPAEKG